MRTPFFTKKATKKSLDELRKIMPVLSEGQQRGYIGRSGSFQNNCFWMSLDYLNTNGNPTVEGALALARAHYDRLGVCFDPATYGGFKGSGHDQIAAASGSGVVSGNNADARGLLSFNPNLMPPGTWEGVAGMSHTVVYRGRCSTGTGYRVFCSVNGELTLSFNDLYKEHEVPKRDENGDKVKDESGNITTTTKRAMNFKFPL